MTQTPTLAQYGDFEAAYAHLNRGLFDNALPDVMFTLARTRHTNGYIIPEGFNAQTEAGERVAEIGLNPETFANRTPREVLSTLAHEMAHFNLYLDGRMPKNGYHCKRWGKQMKAIGLHPSSTGQPGGKETGIKMTHYIIQGGPFQASATALLSAGWALNYFATPTTEAEKARKRKQRASKTAYVCPCCDAKVWGKPGLNVSCEDEHPICKMEAEKEEND
jgi:predicted SprT family Zn-dependent metalloprotease